MQYGNLHNITYVIKYNDYYNDNNHINQVSHFYYLIGKLADW